MNICDRPPLGWFCTRVAGHTGPCAARQIPVVYIAHPLRGATRIETERNRRRASLLVAQIAAERGVAPVCSWIVLSAHWSEEEGRALGLKLDCALIERCDEIWLVGPKRPLSAGMQIEKDYAEKCGVRVVDLQGVYE